MEKKKYKNKYKVPEELQKESIEWLNLDEAIMNYLRENDFETILDIIKRQNDIPHDYCVLIKRKIMFGL